MEKSNFPVNSREYKLMLNPSIFQDLEKGLNETTDTIHRLVEQHGAIFKEGKKDKKRKVWYQDTRTHDLRNDSFLLRIREEKKEDFNITIKNRHSDRYIAALYDLSKPPNKADMIFDRFKFEEDIMPKFTSKYSASVDFKTSQMPKFETFHDVLQLTPTLSKLGISTTETLSKVNNFEANEISYDLGDIKFDDEKDKAKVQLSLWHLSDRSPVIVEFDIDVELRDSPNIGSKELEEYPTALTVGVYKLYMALQGKDIIDNTSPKTKTDFAYEYRKT
jgi:hypothetical protein